MSGSRGTGERVPRFDFAERVVHWTVALTWAYSAISGLALWSHHLFWIAIVLGGGVTVRWAHPLVGLAFTVAMLAMAGRWAGGMLLDAEDRQWLRRSHRYALHDAAGLPPAGRFNAGQKMLFWAQLVATLALVASGLVLWFAGQAPRSWQLAALAVHPIAGVASMGGIVVHVYMALAQVPGSLRAMVRGWVTPGWARSHHPRWYRKVSGS